MNNFGRHIHRAIVGGLALFLAACAGPELKLEPVPATQPPTEYVSTLEMELATARQNKVNVLSPTWFGKAEASLAEARENLERQGEIAQIGGGVSRGRAELQRAEEMAQIARTAIPEAIKARDLARVAGATTLGRDYEDVEEQFLALTREIEDNNLGYAQRNQKNVAEAFRALEIRAIKENTLGEVRTLIGQAESEGAKKLAPQILADARKELEDVDAFISANPYAKEEMHSRANVALFKARRLLQVTRQTGQVRKMEPVDVTLWVEGILQKASAELGAADMRDQPFDTQVENVLGSVGSLVQDRDFLAAQTKSQQEDIETIKKQYQADAEQLRARYEGEISELLKKTAALEGRTREEQAQRERMLAEQRAERERLEAERRAVEERLAAERRFNELYNEVQGMFGPDEAECYKQGQQMVIRLRGMRFPVGQSIILPENYGLLSKVQRAIRTFGAPEVMIEGHTDSTGSPAVNEHLSQQRAEAVRQYLLANGVVWEEQVAAAGYGATRPLAPNTTAEGRAINRRIDVVLTPYASMGQ